MTGETELLAMFVAHRVRLLVRHDRPQEGPVWREAVDSHHEISPCVSL